MKKLLLAAALLLIFCILIPSAVYAREGICGYEGGISSGEVPGKTTYDYKEVTFVTGEPIVLEGTMTIKKQQRNEKTTTTYTYNLRNAEKDATLTRTVVFETVSEKHENGQTTETASISKTPAETLRIGGETYTLLRTNGYNFTRSNIIDHHPAVDFHQGSFYSRKIYQRGTAGEGNTVTVECSGRYNGYDQYWGNAEVIMLTYTITSETNNGGLTDKWGGTAEVTISVTSTEQLQYEKNKPNQISFEGSFLQSRVNNSILKYTAKLPEFDAKGVSTDHIITYTGSLEMETFPTQKRLPTVDSTNIRGHWSEEAIRIMFGLEVFTGSGAYFKPDQYMSRAEFATAMVKIAREVPADPAITVRNTAASKRTSSKEQVISPFDDVSIDNANFIYIKSAYDRGLMSGKGNNLFRPNDSITRAEAITAIMRALGLESIAPDPYAVTTFRDHDQIPAYARNAVYAAQRIGLLKGDSRGYLNPNKKLTKAEGAELFRNLISYLQNGIRKDYSERLISY